MFDTFVRSKALVKNHVDHKIGTHYSDDRGEYQAFTNSLSTRGISYRTTPPHTLEHNGISERRHCHIVKIGLSLLTHASMLVTYWTYAFPTAIYLINCLPIPTLQFSSPLKKLFTSTPNYTKLRVFGCLCYPWLHPYSQHKLDSRSTPCISLGSSPRHSAYNYHDLSATKTYIFRHVQHHSVLNSPTTSTLTRPR